MGLVDLVRNSWFDVPGTWYDGNAVKLRFLSFSLGGIGSFCCFFYQSYGANPVCQSEDAVSGLLMEWNFRGRDRFVILRFDTECNA